MQSILDAINEWIKEILIGAINGNLSTMFGDVNEKVGTIAAEVGKTPQGWNASIFSMIQTLSENVIVPIAGLVITYVLCVELISMVTEKNNLHDIDTFMFFKWFFKAFVAVFIVTHTFDITMFPPMIRMRSCCLSCGKRGLTRRPFPHRPSPPPLIKCSII